MRVPATCFLTLLAAACGNVSGFPDATTNDSQTFDSAPTIDANPRGLVKVTVLDPQGTGAPVTGVPVVFIEPDGKLGARISTDAAGKAEAEVLPGSSVTAVFQTSTNNHEMITITGAQVGDDLVITQSLNNQDAGTFTINFPQHPSATSYYVATPCGSSYVPAPATQYVAPLSQSCKPTGAMTISVNALSQTGWLGYLDKANVMVSAGAANITGTWQAPGSFTSNLTNIPAEATYVAQRRYAPDMAGFYRPGSGVEVTGTTASLTFPAVTASSAVVRTELSRSADQAQQAIYQVTAGNSLSYNLDVGANTLPWFAEPVLDPATGVIKVTTSGSGGGDLFRVSVDYSRLNTATNEYDYYSWTVYGAAPADVTLPQLPIEVGDVNPKATDQVPNSGGEVLLGDAEAITGYDMVREHACQVYLASLKPYETTQLGASTLLRVSYYSPAR